MSELKNLPDLTEPCCHLPDDCEAPAVWDIYDGTDPYGPDACACDLHLSALLHPDKDNVVVMREEWRGALAEYR